MWGNFFRHSICGIDVSDFSVEAISLEKSLGKPKVRAYNRVILPMGAVHDGNIQDPQRLTEALENCFANATPSPIRNTFCALSLPESQVFSHVFQYPTVFTRSEIRKNLLYEVEAELPLRISDCYFDFEVTKTSNSHQWVLFVAALKKVIHSYIEVLQKLHMIPVIFDLESYSTYRACAPKNNFSLMQNTATMLVDIGARTTNMHAFINNKLAGSFTFPSGGMKITSIIMKKFSLPFDRAEEAKKHAGLNPEKTEGKIYPVALSEISLILKEVKKYIGYFEKLHSTNIGLIYLCGGVSLTKGIVEYFVSELDHKVVLANPLEKINYEGFSLDEKKMVLYANVVGLGLRALSREPLMVGINLLSQAKYEKKEKFIDKIFYQASNIWKETMAHMR